MSKWNCAVCTMEVQSLRNLNMYIVANHVWIIVCVCVCVCVERCAYASL